jgi:transcriptional regulator with XRE-family HTH domain
MAGQSREPSGPGRLRDIRVAKDLSQARLARLAGISKRTLERIEVNRDGKVTLWHLVNLALVLECELVDLLDDAWLTYRQTDMTVSPPATASLSPAERAPHRRRSGRERARPRKPAR